MKITYQDKKKNVIEVIPETLDDLWHLSHIVEKGDHISSKTTRRIQNTTGDKIRNDSGVKKIFHLQIELENVNFHIFTGKLRLTGYITKGPEDLIPLGSSHTIEVKLNTPLKIEKLKWSGWVLKRLNKAIESSKKLFAIIISIEDDVADIGLMRQFGIEYYGPIIGNISGKRIVDKNRTKSIIDFYQNIVKAIIKFNKINTIIVAGPGFVKNSFYSYLSDNYPEIAKKSILESTGAGGRSGIQEILKKGTLEKINSENIIAIETSKVNEILKEIAISPSKIVYGKKDVETAIVSGAVKNLLVLDNIVRSENLEELMDLVENMGGEVTVISSQHESGKQLESLGSIAAKLRF
ncbi:MAG: mRNA surveillance protein pelota [Methanobrevibacter sp.]|jgi:protein pelota|nr:mRNA surveillance protein pelota [Candidatus Methanovirga basalitermitum]